MKNPNENLFQEAIQLVDQLEVESNKLIPMADLVEAEKLNVAAAEGTIRAKIASAVNQDTGKLKYSNDSARDAEFICRAAADDHLANCRADLYKTTLNLKQQINRCEAIRLKAGIYKAYFTSLSGS